MGTRREVLPMVLCMGGGEAVRELKKRFECRFWCVGRWIKALFDFLTTLISRCRDGEDSRGYPGVEGCWLRSVNEELACKVDR